MIGVQDEVKVVCFGMTVEVMRSQLYNLGLRWGQIGLIRVQNEVNFVYFWTPLEADPRGDQGPK